MIYRVFFYSVSIILDAFTLKFYNKVFWLHYDPFPLKMSQQQITVLKNNYPYYNKLSYEKKKVFENRVLKFIRSIDWSGAEGFVLSEETKLICAACAIQVSFGFRKYRLSSFSNIIIYPDTYFSVRLNREVKGEASNRGVIVLSWKDLQSGLANKSDNVHLGLHEFMHAYIIESEQNDYLGEQRVLLYRNEIVQIFNDEHTFNAIKEQGYLRSYAFTNEMEFMAVCIEYFFESPLDFRTRLPEVYAQFVGLLNQDSVKLELNARQMGCVSN